MSDSPKKIEAQILPWRDESLAPNEVQVCENFGAWFAESKVVTPAGEPLVLFHGTKTKFGGFDHDKIDSINEGVGFYFTDNRQVAEGYGNVLEVCLSLQNPMPYDREKFSQPVLRKVIQRMAELEAEGDEADIGDGLLSNFGDVRSDGVAKVVAEAARNSGIMTDANDQIASFFGAGVNAKYILTAFREVTGHDGIMANGFSNCGEGDNKIYVAWFPEQIKSVVENSGLYQPDSPEINDATAAKQLLLARQASDEVRTATRSAPGL